MKQPNLGYADVKLDFACMHPAGSACRVSLCVYYDLCVPRACTSISSRASSSLKALSNQDRLSDEFFKIKGFFISPLCIKYKAAVKSPHDLASWLSRRKSSYCCWSWSEILSPPFDFRPSIIQKRQKKRRPRHPTPAPVPSPRSWSSPSFLS